MENITKLVSKAFLMSIVESVRREGPEATLEWIKNVAEYLGEKEGPGLEGDPKGNVNCLYLCPYANMLQEFLKSYGETPSEFVKLLSCNGVHEDFAASNVCCIFHHSFRAKRAELANRSVVHLASIANEEGSAAYNEKAIKAANLTKEEIDELLNKTICIFKYD